MDKHELNPLIYS